MVGCIKSNICISPAYANYAHLNPFHLNPFPSKVIVKTSLLLISSKSIFHHLNLENTTHHWIHNYYCLLIAIMKIVCLILSQLLYSFLASIKVFKILLTAQLPQGYGANGAQCQCWLIYIYRFPVPSYFGRANPKCRILWYHLLSWWACNPTLYGLPMFLGKSDLLTMALTLSSPDRYSFQSACLIPCSWLVTITLIIEQS